ncbi:PPE family protein [Mycobacterium kansasii]|uniref:PPE family protein n=1 Tax=Mycobacterium kansasii TaxID=1768 RepID=A0A1V3XVW1_MYCKA|nr:PPE family protein [Mycobacterium kansasii]
MFEDALAAIVHPAVVATNRNQLVMLAMSNLFGLNAPAIAATEAHYEQMWAQDVAALSGYHAGVSTVAAQLAPWQGVLQTLQGNASSSIAAVNLAAQAESLNALDVSVSFSGLQLVQLGTAQANSTFGGLAVALGQNSSASAAGLLDGPGPWAAPPAPAVVAFSTRRWPWATPAPHRPAACLPWPRPSVAATLSAPVVM